MGAPSPQPAWLHRGPKDSAFRVARRKEGNKFQPKAPSKESQVVPREARHAGLEKEGGKSLEQPSLWPVSRPEALPGTPPTPTPTQLTITKNSKKTDKEPWGLERERETHWNIIPVPSVTGKVHDIKAGGTPSQFCGLFPYGWCLMVYTFP